MERSVLGGAAGVTSITLWRFFGLALFGFAGTQRVGARHASPLPGSIEHGNGFHAREHRCAGIQLQLCA
jgi:hypothetical protein